MNWNGLFNSRIWQWVKRDFLYIILLLFALIASLSTLKQVHKFEAACNDNYMTYIKDNCVCGYEDQPKPFIANTSRYDWLVNATGGYT